MVFYFKTRHIDHEETWVENLLRADWEIWGTRTFSYCEPGQKSTVLPPRIGRNCIFLPESWLILLATLVKQTQLSTRSFQCLHFVSSETVLLTKSEHRPKIPGLWGSSVFFSLQSVIYSGSTYMYRTSSRPVGKVSLDWAWVTASPLPWSVLSLCRSNFQYCYFKRNTVLSLWGLKSPEECECYAGITSRFTGKGKL